MYMCTALCCSAISRFFSISRGEVTACCVVCNGAYGVLAQVFLTHVGLSFLTTYEKLMSKYNNYIVHNRYIYIYISQTELH